MPWSASDAPKLRSLSSSVSTAARTITAPRTRASEREANDCLKAGSGSLASVGWRQTPRACTPPTRASAISWEFPKTAAGPFWAQSEYSKNSSGQISRVLRATGRPPAQGRGTDEEAPTAKASNDTPFADRPVCGPAYFLYPGLVDAARRSTRAAGEPWVDPRLHPQNTSAITIMAQVFTMTGRSLRRSFRMPRDKDLKLP